MQISVEINGNKDNPLLLFANPIEVKPLPKEFPKTFFFKPGIQEIGERYLLESNTTYFLEEGSLGRWRWCFFLFKLGRS